MTDSIDEETHYHLLKLIQENPDITQRQLAEMMGVSVGKVNYCIKALVAVGHIKLNNFKQSKNKLGYMYVLTPKALKEKAQITMLFLQQKQNQYERLKREIEELKQSILSNSIEDSIHAEQ